MESGNSTGSRCQPASPLNWVAAALLVAGSVFVGAGTAQGYRGPFEGRVLDADTRQPIQGAVVAVQWDVGHMTVAGQLDTFYDAAEVLTDANGYFLIKKKWSWNPWTNFRMDSRPPLIYKSGYGRVDVVKWHRIEEVAESMKAQTEETRKRVGPEFYFNIEFENGLPVFLLRRLTTVEERHSNMGFLFDGDALEKLKLLRAEENRERRSLGMEEY